MAAFAGRHELLHTESLGGHSRAVVRAARWRGRRRRARGRAVLGADQPPAARRRHEPAHRAGRVRLPAPPTSRRSPDEPRAHGRAPEPRPPAGDPRHARGSSSRLSFAINLAIWHLTPAGAQDGGFTGGVLALYITAMIVYVQAVTQLLPFAMGLSLSRRTFYLGTALARRRAVAWRTASPSPRPDVDRGRDGRLGRRHVLLGAGPPGRRQLRAPGPRLRGSDARVPRRRYRDRRDLQALGAVRRLGAEHRQHGGPRRTGRSCSAGSAPGRRSASGWSTSPSPRSPSDCPHSSRRSSPASPTAGSAASSPDAAHTAPGPGSVT